MSDGYTSGGTSFGTGDNVINVTPGATTSIVYTPGYDKFVKGLEQAWALKPYPAVPSNPPSTPSVYHSSTAYWLFSGAIGSQYMQWDPGQDYIEGSYTPPNQTNGTLQFNVGGGAADAGGREDEYYTITGNVGTSDPQLTDVYTYIHHGPSTNLTGAAIQLSEASSPGFYGSPESVVVVGPSASGSPQYSGYYAADGAQNALTYLSPAGGFSTGGSYYSSIASSLNPASVPILGSGNTMTLTLVPGGDGEIGHVAISLNGSIAAGLVPQAAYPSPGYNFTNVPGYLAMGGDNDPYDGAVLSMTVNITPQEAQAIQSGIASAETASIQGTEHYNSVGSSAQDSATFANSLAAAAGQVFGGSDFLNFMPTREFMDLVLGEETHNSGNIASIYSYTPGH